MKELMVKIIAGFTTVVVGLGGGIVGGFGLYRLLDIYFKPICAMVAVDGNGFDISFDFISVALSSCFTVAVIVMASWVLFDKIMKIKY